MRILDDIHAIAVALTFLASRKPSLPAQTTVSGMVQTTDDQMAREEMIDKLEEEMMRQGIPVPPREWWNS